MLACIESGTCPRCQSSNKIHSWQINFNLCRDIKKQPSCTKSTRYKYLFLWIFFKRSDMYIKELWEQMMYSIHESCLLTGFIEQQSSTWSNLPSCSWFDFMHNCGCGRLHLLLCWFWVGTCANLLLVPLQDDLIMAWILFK